MPTFRIIRSANAQLYIAAAILMLGAAIYVLCCKDALWQQITAVCAALITPIWAAYYAALRFTVTETGITRHTLTNSQTLNWADITTAHLHESQNQGTASCTITLQAGDKHMRISSEILPLEEVQQLAEDLRKCGLLH